jgi:N-acetyltransferase
MPMGMSRLFVSSSHHHMGIAHSLLDAAAATFLHGCPLDPKKGQVAFSQPTRSPGWAKR